MLARKNETQLGIGRGKYPIQQTPFTLGIWLWYFNGNQIRVQCSFWYAPEVPRVVKIRVATFSGYGTFEDFYELVAIRAAGN